MPYDLLVFDLDGTLIDSALDLALAVNATRASEGLGPLEDKVIRNYVGDGAPMLIRRALGPDAPDEQVDRGLEFFLRYYDEHVLDNTDFYPGVREALAGWSEAGRTLAVLTNKPIGPTRRILTGLGAAELFERVYGGNSFPTKKPEPEGLQAIIAETGGDARRTLMVGDSSVDILTARNAGATSAGVTYGLRPESLAETPPDLLVDSMLELAERLRAL